MALFGLAASAAAFYFYQKAQAPNPTTPTTASNQNESSKPTNPPAKTDQTANWKTYKDEKKGFSFKYPADWARPWANCGVPTPKPDEPARGRSIEKGCLETLIVTEKDSPEEIGEGEDSGLSPYLISTTETTIDGFKARKKIFTDLIGNPARLYDVRVFRNTKLILVWGTSIGPSTDKTTVDELINTLDQILSTFKFLN